MLNCPHLQRIPVNLPADQYFALIVPVCAVLQGLVLIGCWTRMRQQRYLLWVGASYLLCAVPLAVQSLMLTSQLAEWAVVAGTIYMCGIWSAARGMAEKYGGTAYPRIAALVIAVVIGLLYYYSEISDQIWLRMVFLNAALFVLLALPVNSVFRQKRSPALLERILRLSYAALVTYALIRLVIVIVYIPVDIDWELTRSGYWLFMLAMNMMISLWFTFVLLACVMRDLFLAMSTERNQDPLTRLLNRRAFFEQAERQIHPQTGACWALIVCDVDHFKVVNDTWGHAAGDQVLASVAQCFTQQVRQHDLVARFGGEEFVILLNCQDMQAANAVAERMRIQIELTRFTAITGGVTASFGVTLIAAGQSLLAAIEDADAMLYQAKRAGRNQVAYANSNASCMQTPENY